MGENTYTQGTWKHNINTKNKQNTQSKSQRSRRIVVQRQHLHFSRLLPAERVIVSVQMVISPQRLLMETSQNRTLKVSAFKNTVVKI